MSALRPRRASVADATRVTLRTGKAGSSRGSGCTISTSIALWPIGTDDALQARVTLRTRQPRITLVAVSAVNTSLTLHPTGTSRTGDVAEVMPGLIVVGPDHQITRGLDEMCVAIVTVM